jgi:hypothetical protein
MTLLATTFPTVKDYVIGNEPNQPRFWAPQYSDTGKPLAAAQYLPVLASSYDALKAVFRRRKKGQDAKLAPWPQNSKFYLLYLEYHVKALNWTNSAGLFLVWNQ